MSTWCEGRVIYLVAVHYPCACEIDLVEDAVTSLPPNVVQLAPATLWCQQATPRICMTAKVPIYSVCSLAHLIHTRHTIKKIILWYCFIFLCSGIAFILISELFLHCKKELYPNRLTVAALHVKCMSHMQQ